MTSQTASRSFGKWALEERHLLLRRKASWTDLESRKRDRELFSVFEPSSCRFGFPPPRFSRSLAEARCRQLDEKGRCNSSSSLFCFLLLLLFFSIFFFLLRLELQKNFAERRTRQAREQGKLPGAIKSTCNSPGTN